MTADERPAAAAISRWPGRNVSNGNASVSPSARLASARTCAAENSSMR